MNGNNRVSVSEQRLQDALGIEREVSKREHLKTRSWVLVMTAPVWGEAAMAAAGMTAGVLAGGLVMAAGVIGVIFFRRC